MCTTQRSLAREIADTEQKERNNAGLKTASLPLRRGANSQILGRPSLPGSPLGVPITGRKALCFPPTLGSLAYPSACSQVTAAILFLIEV